MPSIGENIKHYREMINMSQEDLALKIRVGASKIESYESGQRVPTNETIMKISTVLDIPAVELLNTRIPPYEENHFEQI